VKVNVDTMNTGGGTGERLGESRVGTRTWLVQPEALSEDILPVLKDIKAAG